MKAAQAKSHVQFKNILFATDFSAAASAAVPFATELTKRYGANLYALYVRPPVINPMTPPVTWSGMEEAAAIEDARHEKELADSFAGIQPEILIKEGDIWSGLTSALEEKSIDLIVIGTRGRSGISKFVLGSIAEEIFRQAPCPVLTVGPGTPAPEKRSGEITKILFATDFSPESNAAAPYAVSLAQECQAYLTLLHVIKPPKAGDLVQAADLVKSSMHLLHNILPPVAELRCLPEYVVEQGDSAEKILEVAGRTGAELIVLGVRQPSGFPGAATHLPIATAHRVVSQAVCPVLTIRGQLSREEL